MHNLSWYGRGPWETFPDRKTNAKFGLYSIAFEEIKFPYLIVQDFDNRADVKWAHVKDEKGNGLLIVAENGTHS